MEFCGPGTTIRVTVIAVEREGDRQNTMSIRNVPECILELIDDVSRTKVLCRGN